MTTTAVALAALAGLMLAAAPAMADDDDWRNDPKVLACAPHTLKHGGTVTLLLGPNHGAEMAVRRAGTRDWYFVVTGDDKEAKAAQAFKAARRYTLDEATTGDADSGKRERIFTRSGRYTVYVSDKLESEAGGNICTIQYRR